LSSISESGGRRTPSNPPKKIPSTKGQAYKLPNREGTPTAQKFENPTMRTKLGIERAREDDVDTEKTGKRGLKSTSKKKKWNLRKTRTTRNQSYSKKHAQGPPQIGHVEKCLM